MILPTYPRAWRVNQAGEFEMNEKNWEHRINELNNTLRDYWQSLQYTPEDAHNDGLTADEYINEITDYLLNDNEEYGIEYDIYDARYIHNQLTEYVNSSWNQFIITTADAAKRLGITDSRVRQLIINNQLPARKMGRDLFIKSSDLDEFAKLDRPVGNPNWKSD